MGSGTGIGRQFIPKVLSVVMVGALCRPLKFFHCTPWPWVCVQRNCNAGTGINVRTVWSDRKWSVNGDKCVANVRSLKPCSEVVWVA